MFYAAGWYTTRAVLACKGGKCKEVPESEKRKRGMSTTRNHEHFDYRDLRPARPPAVFGKLPIFHYDRVDQRRNLATPIGRLVSGTSTDSAAFENPNWRIKVVKVTPRARSTYSLKPNSKHQTDAT
eukprot:1186866-Prorocentrum_minimum.AAC.1